MHMMDTFKKTMRQTESNVKPEQAFMNTQTPNSGRYGAISADAGRDVANVTALVNGVFQDGIVTNDEMAKLDANRDNIMYDFLVAVDVYNDMKKSGAYSQSALDNAHYVMMQLKIARDISYGAVNRAAHYQNASPEEIQLREERRQKKETIQLALSAGELSLVMKLAEDLINLAYMDDKEKAQPLSPQERQQRIDRIQALIQKAEKNRTHSLVLSMYNDRQNS